MCTKHQCPKFTKQTLLSLKEQISPDIVTVEDFSTLLSQIEQPHKNISKDILELNNTWMKST
jgi:hypothetical protein